MIWRGGQEENSGQVYNGERLCQVELLLFWLLTNAVLPIRSELKASIADTLKASLRVDTTAVATHHSIHNTLINI